MNLTHLNEEQLDAVTSKYKNLFILAGAGTGKTSVLTHRIAWIIEHGEADLNEIMAVTFTNKAAKEMRDRLEKMLGVPMKDAWIGTFHGICHKILRMNHKLAELDAHFTIIDEAEQLSLIKRMLLSKDIEPTKEMSAEVKQFINKYKEKGIRPQDVVLDPKEYRERQFKDLYAAYEERCKQEKVIDFAELMIRVNELWRDHPEFRQKFNDRFKFVLVDEFQDTNKVQYEWLRLLVGEKTKVFAVGDDSQSIYAFRGAVVANVNRFIQEYDAKLIKLERNYRSTDAILDLANNIIAINEGNLKKKLHTPKKAEIKPLVYGFVDQDEEAQYVGDKIKQLSREGVPYNEMAVLYRASALSRPFEHVLMQMGIPFIVYGGMRFYERQEVKHALAYMKLMAAPEDDGALLRVINMPPRGIGATSIEKLQNHAKTMNCSVFDAIETAPITGKAKTGLAEVTKIVNELKKGVPGESVVADRLKRLLNISGLRQYYIDQIKAKKEPEERLENLEELVNAARGFEKEFPNSSLEDFLSVTALESSSNKPDKDVKNTVSLMTVHASKGLEFEVVFIAGVEDGLFPNARCLEGDDLEEERRLMYVAVTRAKKDLTMCTCDSRMKYGEITECIPSRFLKEQKELKKMVNYKGVPYIGRSLKIKD